MGVPKLRIAYMGVKGLPSKSGTERVVEAIINQLIGKHDITVYCYADYTPAGTIYKGVRLIRIPTPKGRHLKPILFDILSALHALFWGQYDVIHMHGVENSFTLPLLKLRFKILSTAHGIPKGLPTNISKWSKTELFFIKVANYPFIYFSDCPTSISSIDSEYFYNRYKKKVPYIPNGVENNIPVDRDAALGFIKNLGLAPNSFLLFIAGRVIERKGCHLLLEARNKLNLDLPVVVIGDMEQVPEYSQRLKNLAANKQVIFVPPIADKGLLFGILSLCKLFVFPSIAEGMSMMLLETASLGIPMVCSDIPENKIVLGEHVTYFRSEDHNDLAEKISWALENMDEVTRFATLLKKLITSNYSWDSIASKYELLYQKLYKNASSQ